MQKNIKEKFFESSSNKTCFDCQAANPEWVSVNNAIFLCKECQLKHRSYGVSVSYIRSLEMDTWKEEQINLLRLGGNERLQELMTLYNIKFNIDRSELYFSKILDYYRRLLKAELKGETRPQPPQDEEALLPCEKGDTKLFHDSNNPNNEVFNINQDGINQDYNIQHDEPGNDNSQQSQGGLLGNISSYAGPVSGFVGGLWNTTKDVAVNLKNKADESGLTEKVVQKTNLVAEKLKEGSKVVADKAIQIGNKGMEVTLEKYEEVVS